MRPSVWRRSPGAVARCAASSGQDIGGRSFEQGRRAAPRLAAAALLTRMKRPFSSCTRQTDRKPVHDLLEQIGVALSLLLALANWWASSLSNRFSDWVSLDERPPAQPTPAERIPARSPPGRDRKLPCLPPATEPAGLGGRACRTAGRGRPAKPRSNRAAGSTSHPTRARNKWPKRAWRLARNGPPRSSCVRPDPPGTAAIHWIEPFFACASTIPPLVASENVAQRLDDDRERTSPRPVRVSAFNALTSDWAWRVARAPGRDLARARSGIGAVFRSFPYSMTNPARPRRP